MPAPDTKVATSARPAPSRLPIEGPSAWVGADMRGRQAEWTYRLSPPEIVEIETAVKAVQARGLDIARSALALGAVQGIMDAAVLARADVLSQ